MSMNDKKIASPILGRLHIEVFDANRMSLAERTTGVRRPSQKMRSSELSWLECPLPAGLARPSWGGSMTATGRRTVYGPTEANVCNEVAVGGWGGSKVFSWPVAAVRAA
jgi:hypothetical protein